MKVIFTQDPTQSSGEGSTVIKDINLANLSVDDGEATEIVVDDFLSSYPLHDVANIFNVILNKLRQRGTITITFIDIEFAAYRLSRGFITTEEFNEIIFYKSVRSLTSCDVFESILQKFGIVIESKRLISETCTAIITGRRS